jgi:microcystin-dependent protein
MATTTCRTYPYPTDADPINVAGDLQNLAEAVDADICTLAAQVGSAVPVGTLLISAGVTEPVGYLFCRGQAVPRATYPDLFAAISTRFGAGDGTNTFNLPNMQATLPVGFNTLANQPPGIGNSFSVGVGERAGSADSVLPSHQHTGVDHLHGVNQYVSVELQAHNHYSNHGTLWRSNPFVPIDNVHVFGATVGQGYQVNIEEFPTDGANATGSENQNHNHAMNATTDPADRNLATGFTGISPSGGNYPPCVSFNYIIKAVAG